MHPTNGGFPGKIINENQYEDPNISDDEELSEEDKEKLNDKKYKICLYELLCGMILMGFAESHNKLRMLFNLFDFDQNLIGLEQDEFILFVTITLEAWGRFT